MQWQELKLHGKFHDYLTILTGKVISISQSVFVLQMLFQHCTMVPFRRV